MLVLDLMSGWFQGILSLRIQFCLWNEQRVFVNSSSLLSPPCGMDDEISLKNHKCWKCYRAMQWRTLEGVTSDARPSLMFNGDHVGESSDEVLRWKPEIETARVDDNYISRIFTACTFTHGNFWKLEENVRTIHVQSLIIYCMYLEVYLDVFSEWSWLGRLRGPWITDYSEFWSPSPDSWKLYYVQKCRRNAF